MDTEVLVIGEALIDIVEGDRGVRELVGGSPANVAVGLARQGHGVSLLTRLGRDDRGERIAAQLEGQGHEGAGLEIDEASWTDAPTSTARARLQPDGSARYEFEIDWDVPVARRDGIRALHTGSIALFLEPGGTAVLDALQHASSSAFVSLDPNIRPALVGPHAEALERFERAAALADLVKLSDEDAEWLYPGLPGADVLTRVAGLGEAGDAGGVALARLVVMTRGGEGAIGLGPGGIAEVPAIAVTVADTIGAGDAYMASLISSALDDPAMCEDAVAFTLALRRAAVMAGITVSRAGANPPTRAEVNAAL